MSLPKASRATLAKQLVELLPEGLPKEVRARAHLVVGRLRGLCESCAALPEGTAAPPSGGTP